MCPVIGEKLDLLRGNGKQCLFWDMFTRIQRFMLQVFFFAVKIDCKPLSMLSCSYMPAAAILIKPKREALEFACSRNNANGLFISAMLLAECRAVRCILTSL